MPYLNEAGLAYYNEKLQPWISSQPVKTIPSSLYPWSLTEKAGAVTCWPVGGTELKPTVDFMFTETPPSNGQPKAPDNPSTIAGVTQAKVTRCGKNLYNLFSSTLPDTRLPAPDSDGWIIASGDKNTYGTRYPGLYNVPSPAIEADKTYTLVVEIETISNCSVQYVINSSLAQRSQLNTGTTNTLNSAGTHFIVCSNNNLYDPNCVVRTLVIAPESGQFSIKFRSSVYEGVVDSSNFEYTPYSGTDYTIPFGSTYYGGSIDLATGVMTVTHSAVTPDASTVDISSDPAALPLDYADTYGRTITSADGTSLVVGSTGGTVVYKLATPQTVQLTPTQILALAQTDKYTPRLNTVYTDASSIQVGYVKSPIRNEFELQQAIVAQGGNI